MHMCMTFINKLDPWPRHIFPSGSSQMGSPLGNGVQSPPTMTSSVFQAPDFGEDPFFYLSTSVTLCLCRWHFWIVLSISDHIQWPVVNRFVGFLLVCLFGGCGFGQVQNAYR